MLLTLAAEHVRSGQPLRLTVQGLEPEPPQPIDLVWRGRPGWESPRPFFMLLDRGDATRPRELELCVRKEAPVCTRWRGFGAQGDLFFRTRRLRELGVTDDDARLIHDRIREMKPQLVRLCCEIREWEPELGKPDLQSEWLEDLCETLAVYQEAGSEVILTEWGHKLPDWCPCSPDPRNNKAPAPEMRREFARSWADLLYYLRRERGFTHVKYVILYNEPNGGGAPLTRQKNIDFADWAEIVRLLDGELRRLGLRGEVAVLGPDEVGTIGWLPRAVIELDTVLDHYCVHSYLFDNGAGFEDYLRECLWYLPRHHADGRQGLMITEFGMSGGGVWVSPQNDTFANGLFLADVAVRAARLGIEAVLMWCLSDTNYGQAMKWGLWRFKDEGWQPRPGYYAWRLLTRHTRLDSRVFAVAAGGDVAPAVPAVAFKSPAGEWTVLIVNTNARPTPATLKNLPPDTCFTRYEYSPETMTDDAKAATAPVGNERSDAQGNLQWLLPASSLTVLAGMSDTKSTVPSERLNRE